QFLYFAYRGKGFDFLNPHLVESLFSARHGLISWTPVIFLALTGVLFFLRKQPKFGTAFLCVFLLQWYLNASWGNWWFGHSFGNRAYVNCSVIFALGLAAFLEASEKWKKPVYSLLAMLTLWNFLFMAQYTTKMVPQGRAVDWNKVLTNQFKIFSKIWELLERLIA
ncbi:MAG: hypothetical protein GY801_07165, partial [bacterium]|nr:hypothetical protein [bacterium]